mgnify:FL=1
MSDRLDLRDVMLEAIADVREIFREVMIEATAPMVEMELRQMWAQMPQELKDRLAAERPEEYEMLMKQIGSHA